MGSSRADPWVPSLAKLRVPTGSAKRGALRYGFQSRKTSGPANRAGRIPTGSDILALVGVLLWREPATASERSVGHYGESASSSHGSVPGESSFPSQDAPSVTFIIESPDAPIVDGQIRSRVFKLSPARSPVLRLRAGMRGNMDCSLDI